MGSVGARLRSWSWACGALRRGCGGVPRCVSPAGAIAVSIHMVSQPSWPFFTGAIMHNQGAIKLFSQNEVRNLTSTASGPRSQAHGSCCGVGASGGTAGGTLASEQVCDGQGGVMHSACSSGNSA